MPSQVFGHNFSNDIFSFDQNERFWVKVDGLDLIVHFFTTDPLAILSSENLESETGWFAGRAVALALVETEYFYWLDDDFDIQDSNVFAQDQDSNVHELFSTYGHLRGFGNQDS